MVKKQHFFEKEMFYQISRGAAIFTASKNTAAVFLAKSVKKWVCFCQFQLGVYNWHILFSTGLITPAISQAVS